MGADRYPWGPERGDERQGLKMVRLGLLVADDDEMETEEEAPRMRAPMEDDEEDRRTPQKVVYSPGGLFSSPSDMAVDEGRRGASAGREMMGLSAQLGLSAEATSKTRAALATPRKSSAKKSRLSSPRSVETRRQRPVAARVALSGKVAESRSGVRAMLDQAHSAVAPEAGTSLSKHGRDFGLFMGRGFRASFSCTGRLARPTLGDRVVVETPQLPEVPEAVLSAALDRLAPEGDDEDDLRFRALDLRRRSLARTVVDFAEAYEAAGATRHARVWELVRSLWFSALDHDDEDYEERAPEEGPPRASMSAPVSRRSRRAGLARDARYEAVADWLAGGASTPVEEDDEVPPELASVVPAVPLYRKVSAQLWRRDVSGAAATAVDGGATRLALVVASSQAAEARSALDLEFAATRDRATEAGGALLARAAGVAAGRLELEDEIGALDDGATAVPDWATRLGLHVWYERPPSIAAALSNYDAAAFDRGTARQPLANGKQELDRAYRLLQLGCADAAARGLYDDAYDHASDAYARCLAPFAVGATAGDVGASWQLHLVLDALRLNSRDANAIIAAKLADGLIFQLIATGQASKWAAFVVAASFGDAATRHRLARQLIDRRLTTGDESVLDPPPAWIEASRGLLAGLDGPAPARASALIGARDFSGAHRALLLAAAPPRALFADLDSLTILQPLLETLDAHLAHDPAWQAGAGLYLAFLRFKADLATATTDVVYDLIDNARVLRDHLEAAAKVDPPLSHHAPRLGACATALHVPHLDAACRQHIATTLANAHLQLLRLVHADAPSRHLPPPPLLDDLARSQTFAPTARLDLLDDLALDLLPSSDVAIAAS